MFHNSLGFFVSNLGLEETKQLIIPLAPWKGIDRKTRQELLRDLNWEDRRKSIFEKEIDLDAHSVYVEAEIQPPVELPAERSMWTNDLDLQQRHYEGYGYSKERASNLERAIGTVDGDLISTARLAGFYSRCRQSLDSEEVQRLENIKCSG